MNSAIMSAYANRPGMPKGSQEALAVKNISLDRPMVDRVAEVDRMLGQEHGLIMLGEVSIDKGLENMAKRSKEIQNGN
jgi:multiple sugar transport system substrate-binding protein